MMRRTKYVVVQCIFCSSNKVERALGRTDVHSESSFMIYLVPDSVPRLGHTGPEESERQLLSSSPPYFVRIKGKNCSIKRHCNYLPLDIFRPQLALLLDLVHMHIVFLKVCLPLLPLPKKPRQFELQIQLIRKSGLNIAF